MPRIRNRRPDPEKAEALALLRGTIEEFGLVVIPIPEYCSNFHEKFWERDYSELKPEDAKVFRWLDEGVDQGLYNRGPYGRDICYYSKKGTRSYEAGRH